MGDVRVRRPRPAAAARLPHRRVRRRDVPRLRLPPHGGARRGRGLHRHRHLRQRPVRAGGVHVRPRRPRGHRRHRLLVVPGGAAPRGAGAAVGGVRPRPRRWRDGDGHPRHVHRVLPAARAVHRRPVQVVRGGSRRHRLGRGRRRAAGAAPLRRPARRSSRPRRGAGHRRQPGRRVERPDRAERAVAAAGDPAGPRQRAADRGGRGRRRGPRHRHHPRRPDRGAGPAGHVRAGPGGHRTAAARFDQVQHRPHPGRGRRGRRHQDGPGHAARHRPADAARGRALPARRLDRRGRRPGDRGDPVAGRGPAPPGGRLLVRHLRHQRARRAGTRPRAHGPGGVPAGRRRRRRDRPARALRRRPGRAAGTGRPAAVPPRRVPGDRSGRDGVRPRDHPGVVPAPGRRARPGPGPAGPGPHRARRRRARPHRRDRYGAAQQRARLRLLRTRRPLARDGRRPAGQLARLRRVDRRVRGRPRPLGRLVADRRAARRRRRPAAGRLRRGAAHPLGGAGLPGPAVALPRRTAGRGGRALPGRDRRRLRGRRPLPRGCRPDRRPAQPGARRHRRQGRHGLRQPARRPGPPAAGAVGRPALRGGRQRPRIRGGRR
ncbi:hypothetical protein B0E53_06627 [Micromonospora sp. MH33]|nr:hypothetical protein B0E53_06627 [Micromonospora sp. MH33]